MITLGVAVGLMLLPSPASAAKDPDECRPPGDQKLHKKNAPVDSASRTTKDKDGKTVNERTEYFLYGIYWVTQCDPDTNEALVSTLAGPEAGSNGQPVTQTKIIRVGPDRYRGTTSEYTREWFEKNLTLAMKRAPKATSAAKYRVLRTDPAWARKRQENKVRRLLGVEPRQAGRASASGYAGKCQIGQYILFGFSWPYNGSLGKRGYSFFKNPNGGWPDFGDAFVATDQGHSTWTLAQPNVCGWSSATPYGVSGAGINYNATPLVQDGISSVGFRGGVCPGALACADFWGSGGTFTECDVVYKSDFASRYHTGSGSPPGDKYDMRAVMAHEAGHCLGLAHSDEHPDYDNGQILDNTTEAGDDSQRHMGRGDHVGFHFIYP